MTKPKILIVDDEPFNVDYLEQELADTDCEILTAANGREALEQVRAAAPDLVLLDIMMPVMDGFEALSRLKADAETRDIAVIVISANNDLRSVVKGIQLGAEDYLPKPFEPALLHARISSSLEKKRLRDLQKLYLKSLERELEIGREIQRSFLPFELPSGDGWEIAALFKAAREVAGDFYDAFLLPGGELACVVGDVCGHGVGAALFMTLFRSLIRATSTNDAFCGGADAKVMAPAERLRQAVIFTNNYIADTHGSANMFATLFIALIDPRSGTLAYVNCGNEPPFWVDAAGAVRELSPSGPVIGLFADVGIAVKQIQPARDGLLLIFTDGIPDAHNPQQESFGRERLLKIVQGGERNPAGLLRQVEEAMAHFCRGAEQFDDITALAIRVRAAAEGKPS